MLKYLSDFCFKAVIIIIFANKNLDLFFYIMSLHTNYNYICTINNSFIIQLYNIYMKYVHLKYETGVEIVAKVC